jgi:hypothetical protein
MSAVPRGTANKYAPGFALSENLDWQQKHHGLRCGMAARHAIATLLSIGNAKDVAPAPDGEIPACHCDVALDCSCHHFLIACWRWLG